MIQADERLFLLLNNTLEKIPGLEYVLGWPTWLGQQYVLLPLTAALLIATVPAHWKKILCAVVFAYVGSAGFCFLMKTGIDRPRPAAHFAALIEQGRVGVHVMFKSKSEWSFPSGHATDITSVVTVLNILYRQRLKLLYLLIPWIALTRIYVGAHFPLDVIGGITVGFIGAHAAIWLIKRVRYPDLKGIYPA